MRSLRAIDLPPRAEYLVKRQAAHGGDIRRATQLVEPVHGGLDQVVRVTAAEAFGEHILHAGDLEHCTHARARDHSSTRRGGLEEHAAGPETSDHQVRDRAAARHWNV